MEIADAMLMAAGLGTRLRPFTDACPKAVLPLMDVPVAQFAIDALDSAGIKNIVTNVHHHAELAKRVLAELDPGGAALRVSDESAELLGSAGGIKRALPFFGGRPFLLLNADVLMDFDLAALARAHARLRSRQGVHLTLAVLELPPSAGAYREIHVERDTGLISSFGEVVRGKPFFAGAAILEPEALRLVPEGPADFLEMILAPAVRAGKAGAYRVAGLWRDVGSPELWHRAHLDLMDKLETGALNPRVRGRLERSNRRITQGVWVSKRAPVFLGRKNWNSPCYWAPEQGSSRSEIRAQVPRELGAGAILYGNALPGMSAAVGSPWIGFGGHCQRLESV